MGGGGTPHGGVILPHKDLTSIMCSCMLCTTGADAGPGADSGKPCHRK